MAYLDQFLSAIAMLREFEPTTDEHINFIQDFYRNYTNSPDMDILKEIRGSVKSMSKVYAENAPTLAHQCHSISQGFSDTFNSMCQNSSTPCSLSVTVGEVEFNGRSLYNVTQDSVRAVMQEGFNPSKSLDVHVWLTLNDMTVYDLTIMSTLHAKGLIPNNRLKRNLVVVAKNGITPGLKYTPFLVDNYFMHRIDRVEGIVTA